MEVVSSDGNVAGRLQSGSVFGRLLMYVPPAVRVQAHYDLVSRWLAKDEDENMQTDSIYSPFFSLLI